MRIIDTSRRLIISFAGEQPLQLESGDHRIDEARELINQQEDTSTPEFEEAIRAIFAKTKEQTVTESVSKHADGFEFEGDQVKYKGRFIAGELKEVLIRMHDEDSRNLSHFQKFLDLLFKNPASHAVEELYDYIGRHQIVIDQDGWIIAWKSVDNDGWSHHGNLETIVESGEVDESGRILNVLGEEVRVDRNQVDDDRSIGCSFGLHAGSYEYASSFGYGNSRLMEVKINPVDVVSIPHDCDCQKMRVCGYTPLSLSYGKITASSVDTSGGTVKAQKTTEEILQDIIARLVEGEKAVEIRDVLEDLAEESIHSVSPITVFDTAVELGFDTDSSYGNILDWEIYQDEDEYEDEDIWDLD